MRWSQSVEEQGREAHVAGMEILQESEGDRQKHRRALVSEAEVTCTVSGLMGTLGLSRNIAKSLVDISEDGCKLVLEKKVEPGHRVELHLSFKHPALKVDTEGIVRRFDRDTLQLAPGTTPKSSSRTWGTRTPPISAWS